MPPIVRIATSADKEPHGDIEYRAVRVAPNEVEPAVVNLLRYFEAPGALIFCATRENVRRLHATLVGDDKPMAAVATRIGDFSIRLGEPALA